MRRALGLIVLSLIVSGASTARASVRPAADVDLALGERFGWGFGGRLGYELDLVVAKVVPEVGGGYLTFAPVPDKEGRHILRGFVGARLGFGGIISPSFFAHLGYGRISTEGALPNEVSANGATADAGGALDFTMLPLVNVGFHAGAAVMAPSSSGGSKPLATGSVAPPGLGTTVWGFFGLHVTLRVP